MLRQLSFAVALGVCFIAGLPGQVADEYLVKAAFLYNFAKFVEWPPKTFPLQTDPMGICVIGDTPLYRAIEESIDGKAIDGRRLVVKKISDVKEANTCQILFISGSDRNRPLALLESLNVTGILTVGEREGFAAQGGVINFKLENGRVRFEINVAAASQQRLHISSKLLSLAQTVKN